MYFGHQEKVTHLVYTLYLVSIKHRFRVFRGVGGSTGFIKIMRGGWQKIDHKSFLRKPKGMA